MVVIGDELRTSVANSIHHERGRWATIGTGGALIGWALAIGGGGPRTVAAIIVGGLVMTAGLLAPYVERLRPVQVVADPALVAEVHGRIATVEEAAVDRVGQLADQVAAVRDRAER